jgi:DNA topoisomerase VI subunit B
MGPNGHMRKYSEREMPVEFRDVREGRSPSSRRMYMESKELHHDKAKKMKELEKYMQELTLDIAEMIEDSSPEEKQLLHKKITALASKIETL